MFRASLVALIALSACRGGPDGGGEPLKSCAQMEGADVSGGLLGLGPAEPFPNAMLLDADGHLDLDPAWFGGLNTDGLAWRAGFSVAQGSVVSLPDVDPAALPGWETPTPGTGGVVLVDLTEGVFLPVFAELDANNAIDPALMVQPLVGLTPGHRIAVAVMDSAAPRPDRFEALINGEPPADYEGAACHYRALMDDLSGLGMAVDDIALAWDFPIDDARIPLTSGLAQLQTPTEWDLYDLRQAGDEDVYNDTWRYRRGTFTVQDFLIDDKYLNVMDDGTIASTGSTEATVVVIIPDSAKDAPAGSVPVLIHGHGGFSHPSHDLNTPDWYNPSVHIAETHGMIVVATTFRGLEYNDLTDTLTMAVEPQYLLGIADRGVQGQLNTQALMRMVEEGNLLSDPLFHGESGQVLADASRRFYFGQSLGSMMSFALMGQEDAVEAAVIPVGGGALSWTFQRSSEMAQLSALMKDNWPDPTDLQRVFQLFQLTADPYEPLAYVDAVDTPMLLQAVVGDEAVHSAATEMLARSYGMTVLEPTDVLPFGVESAPGPLGPSEKVLSYYDPELGETHVGNTAAAATGAHMGTQDWPGFLFGASDFLDPASPGIAEHPCGDAPCSVNNP